MPSSPSLIHTSDGSPTLCHVNGETYHSRHGALTESEHVFIQATGLQQRANAQSQLKILEVGFGTGLNFRLTAQHCAHQCQLHYDALERDPIDTAVLQSLNLNELFDDRPLEAALLEHWPAFTQRRDCWQSLTLPKQGQLQLYFGDATNVSLKKQHYDIVYMDAFSPDTSPELWTPSFLGDLFQCLRPGGVLSTYCAKGRVRRDLQSLGFQVSRLPGPPKKREMLLAARP